MLTEWNVVVVRTGRSLYEATAEKGAVRMTNEKTAVKSPTFRVYWRLGIGAAKKGTRSGVAKTFPTEKEGREAFGSMVRSAVAQGWKQVPIGLGRRPLELKPIPPPKKRSA